MNTRAFAVSGPGSPPADAEAGAGLDAMATRVLQKIKPDETKTTTPDPFASLVRDSRSQPLFDLTGGRFIPQTHTHPTYDAVPVY